MPWAERCLSCQAALEINAEALIRRAGQQIAAEPGGQLAWLLRFVREDSTRWNPSDAEGHGHRLLSFIYQLPENLLRLGDQDISPVTPYSVEEIHAELNHFFRDLLTSPEGKAMVPADGLEEGLHRASAVGAKPAIFGIGRGGPRRTLLYQKLKALILEAGDKLIACHQCGAPILARGRRLFCPETKCLQTWHDREKAKQRGKGRAR